MTWEKQNLVTLPDGSDVYQCSLCGYKKKYFGLARDRFCPKCNDEGKGKKKTPIWGAWTNIDRNINCGFCRDECITVPKKGHPNSRFWVKQLRSNEKLVCCPNGCLEDGSFIGKSQKDEMRKTKFKNGSK